jgi:hypothetical protein
MQYHWKISLPLISITRLLPFATSSTRFSTHTRGLLYLTNHHIHDYKLQALHQDFTGLQQLIRRVFIDQEVVYIVQVYQRIQPDSHQEKVQSSKSKPEKVTICEATVHQDGISKWIFQYHAARDRAAFTTQWPTTTYLWQTTWEYDNGPSVRVLCVKKNPDIGSGAAGYISSGKKSVFSALKTQDPPIFYSKQQEVRGLHSVSAPFLQKSAHH